MARYYIDNAMNRKLGRVGKLINRKKPSKKNLLLQRKSPHPKNRLH